MNKKTFYVTTPIYYPSGKLHIGHLYTTTLAWVLKNYKSLMGFDAKFLTGADEHGQKIELKAQENKQEPQEYVDSMHQLFTKLWKDFKIEYDFYSRTSNHSHKRAIQNIFEDLKAKGFIYKGRYKGLYSIQDEEFVLKKNAKEKDGKFYHPDSNHLLDEKDEETYFLNISKLQPWLEEYIAKHPNFIIPLKNVNELKSNFLTKGVQDLSISRSNIKWGTPIASDPSHVIYVWLDALNNYITTLGYSSASDNDFQKYWNQGDEIVHIVGKEISRFHCIYWPIILKMLGLKQPSTILSHGWIITPAGKMSKSKGNVVDPYYLINKYGPEEIKYFFASQINVGQDSIFDEASLISVLNADLANNYGNLLSRTLAMIKQNFDRPVKFKQTTNQHDVKILNIIKEAKKEYVQEFDQYKINKALNIAIDLSKHLNGYIDLTKPWTLKEDKDRLEIVLNNLLNGIYAVSTMLSVVLPEKMAQVTKLLNIEKLNWSELCDFEKFDQITTQNAEVLFARIK